MEIKDGSKLQNTPQRKQGICKTIASFANPDGGSIIYGLSQSNHKASGISSVNGNNLKKNG